MSDQDMNEIKAAQVLKCLADAITYGLNDVTVRAERKEEKKATEYTVYLTVDDVAKEKNDEVPV